MSTRDLEGLPVSSRARENLLPPHAIASVRVLITCYDRNGHQVSDVSTRAFRTAFSAIKDFTSDVLARSETALSRFDLDVSLMQVGPCSYDLRFDLLQPEARLATFLAKRYQSRLQHGLEMAVMRFSQASQLMYVMAAHPDADLLCVETADGPMVDIHCGDSNVLRVDPLLLNYFCDGDNLNQFRNTQAVPADPDVDYVVVSTTFANVPSAMNVSYPVNDHVRDFLNGAPLPVLERYQRSFLG